MRNDKIFSRNCVSIVAIVLLLSMIAVTVLINENNLTARADTTTSTVDLSQYEWTQMFHDSSRTRASDGPGPSSASILWKSSDIANTGSISPGFLIAFNNKVFCTTTINGVSYIEALNGVTGQVVWQTAIPLPDSSWSLGAAGGPQGVQPIDDNHVFVGIFPPGTAIGEFQQSGAIVCFDANTGNYLWTSDVYGESESPGGGMYFNYLSVPEIHRLYTVANVQPTRDQPVVRCFDTSNPDQPFPIAWDYDQTLDGYGGDEILCYGEGKVFVGSYNGYVFALDAYTGERLWVASHTGQCGYSGEYIDGVLLAGSASTHMTAYNGTTGAIIWDSNEGGRAFFAYGGTVANGVLYQHNIAVPQGYFAAWSIANGEKLWSIPAYYYIGYNVPVYADNKVYCILSDGSTTTGRNATPTSFACMDAQTGAIIWQISTTFGTPIIAYGNLYGVANGQIYCFGSTAQDWTGFEGNQANKGISYSGSPADVRYPSWTFETDGPLAGSAAVSNGKVYFGSTDKNIYCLDAFTGQKIWSRTLNFGIRSTPAVVAGVVYTGADDGNVYALDATTGDIIWTAFAGGKTNFQFTSTFQLRSSPIIDGSNLIVGALDGKVYCIDISNQGNIKWTVQTGSAIGASAAITDGIVYIPSTDGTLLAINEANGNIIWNVTVPGSTDLGKICMVSTPTVAEGKVFVENGQEYFVFFGPPAPAKFFAFDQATGNQLFNTTVSGGAPETKSFIYYNGILYGSQDMYAVALNASDGQPIWRQWLGHQVFSTPAIDPIGGRFYIGCDSYGIQCLDLATGTPITVFTTQAQVDCSPALWDGKLYIGSQDGTLYCFSDAPTQSMSISLSVNSASVSQQTTVSGKLNPGAVSGAAITVTFIKPDGTADQQSAVTDETGRFQVTYTPTVSGTYSVIASYGGYQSEYYSYSTATSDSTPMVVSGTSTTTSPSATASQTTSPTTSTTTAVTAEPTSTSTENTSNDNTLYIIVAVVVIVIIIAAVLVLVKRKK